MYLKIVEHTSRLKVKLKQNVFITSAATTMGLLSTAASPGSEASLGSFIYYVSTFLGFFLPPPIPSTNVYHIQCTDTT